MGMQSPAAKYMKKRTHLQMFSKGQTCDSDHAYEKPQQAFIKL